MAQPLSVPPAPLSRDSRLALARKIDARLRGRRRGRRRSYALDAFDLAECKRLGLFRLLGYSSVTAYARDVNGFGSSKTSSLIRIAEACQRLPKIRQAFLGGELDWCAAREIVKKATPEDEEEWLTLAKTLTVSELRARVQERDPVYRRNTEYSGEDLAAVEALVEVVRKKHGPMSFGKALGIAARDRLEGRGTSLGASVRIVIHRCPECEKASYETSEGPVLVRPEDLERVSCDAEVLDLRHGPARVSRTVPPRIKNFVLGRDRGRCVVPGCRNPADDFHHEKGWRRGHDPSHCFGLCGSHHRARHEGCLRAEGAMPDLHFYLADGTYLGRAGDRQRASEASGRPGEPAPAEASAHEDAPARAEASAHEDAPARAEASAHEDAPFRAEVQAPAPAGSPEARWVRGAPDRAGDAIKALRKLGFSAREAKEHVQHVLHQRPGRSWGTADLVRAVLQGLPLAG